jgi:hypothetical protein
MQGYQALVGKQVEAIYRTGEIQSSAVGILVSDSGESISIEERFSQNGKQKTMRVEIPYKYVIQVVEAQTRRAEIPPQYSPTSKKRS